MRRALFSAAVSLVLQACAHPVPPQGPEPEVTSLQGRIVDEEGEPIAGALVTVARPGGVVGFEVVGQTKAGAEGGFEFRGLAPGVVHVTAASAEHVAQAQCEQVLSEGASLKTADFVLSAGGVVLSGQIGDSRGVPLPGGQLVVTPFSPQTGPSPCGVIGAMASADGSYAVRIEPGSYALFGRAQGHVEQIAVERVSEARTQEYRLDPAAEKVPAPDEVVDWVRARQIPLDTVEPGNGFEDLAPLGTLIGDASVVALGESTHGTREFFQLKHRVLEYLVAEKGFTAFALEAAMPEAFDLNRYILTGEGDPRHALAGLVFWTWDTEEMLALIEWMRQWNQEHEDKIRFYGMDVQSGGRAFERVSAYLGAHELTVELPALEPLARARTARELEAGSVQAAAELVETLDTHRERLIAASSESEWQEVRQCARVVQQHTAFVAGQLPRDAAMAENVRWVLEREEKVAVWAHNGHVSSEPGTGTMGAALREELGEDLIAIGLEFASGSFQAIPFPFWQKQGVQDLSVPALEDESLPAMLSRVGSDRFALDLRAVPPSGEVHKWFAARRPAHAIGAGFPSGTPGYGPMAQLAVRQYDALLFVRDSTPTRPTPTGSRPAREVHESGPQTFGAEGVGELPEGWTWSPDQEGFGYRASVVSCGTSRCAEIRQLEGPTYGQKLARLTRRVPLAAEGPGTVLRTEARVLSAGEASVRVTVEGGEEQRFAVLGRAESELLTGGEWQDVVVELELTEDVRFVVFELLFEGKGSVRLDALQATSIPKAPSEDAGG